MVPVISVIVPVYKVETYLDECVESLVQQTFQDLEIILVDDGSPDHCPDMCEDWARKDSRIKVIHKHNGGLSSARNAGLEVAHGAYVSFVDSDDFFDSKMYEKLFDAITSSNTIGISSIKFYKYIDGSVCIYNEDWDHSDPVIVKSEDFGTLTLKQKVCHAATNKLYRKDLLENVRFREGKLNEDVLFTFDLAKIVKQKHVDMLELPYYAYYYRMRSNSICNSTTPINIAYIDNLKIIVAEAEDNEMKNIAFHQLKREIYLFCCFLLNNDTNEGREWRKSFWREYHDQLRNVSYADISDSEKDSFFTRFGFWLVKYCPVLYPMFKK